MVVVNLQVDLKRDIILKENEKEKLSFLVSRVFDEYVEDIQDSKLSEDIKGSIELDTIINNIKF